MNASLASTHGSTTTKRLCATLCLVAVAALSQAQSWTRQSAIPSPRNLNSVAFVSVSHGFASGESNTLLETLDGGVTWRQIGPGLAGEPFYHVYFRDENNGFILGNTGTTSESFRTTDGGATWARFDLPAGSWYEMDFVNPTTGFAGGNGALCRTIDGGATWTLRSAYPNAPVVYGMDFRDSNVGLVCGYLPSTNEQGVFRTADGGVTWTFRLDAPCNDAVWMDASTALACGGTSIFRSTDAGLSWSLFTTGIDTGLLELVKVTPSLVFGVSVKGDIWRSGDGGLSWTMVFDGLGDLPASWNIGFADSFNGWVVGQGGLMLHTTDGGLTWAQASNGFGAQWFQIEMANDATGYIAGHNGYVLLTRDGGLRWDLKKVEVTGQIFGRDESLRAVSVVDADTAVVAGPGGTVFKTLDGGDTWQNIGYPSLPGAFWIEDVKFIDADQGWIVGLDQDLGHFRTVYHTVDGGLSWTLAFTPNSYCFSVDFTDALHGWIATIGSLYFRTVDGGATWSSLGLPPRFTAPSVSQIRFFDQNVGWVVGWDGLIGKSTDGGETFVYQDIGSNDVHLFSLSIVSASEVWVSGRTAAFDPVVFHTTDGGLTWIQMQGPDDPNWLYTLAARPGEKVWGAGYDGIVFRRSGTTTTDVPPVSSIWLRGRVQSGNNASLAANDDDFYVCKAGLTLGQFEAPAQLQVDAFAPLGTVVAFDFETVSKVNTPGLSGRIELYNRVTGQYELVGTQVAQTTESSHVVSATGDLARFVQAGTRAIRAKVSWFRSGITLVYPWTVSVDQVRWRIQTQ